MHNRSHQHGRGLNILLAAIAAFAIGLAVYYFQDRLTNEASVDALQKAVSLHSDPRELPEFSLIDQRGVDFKNKDLKGNWNLIFFGFTNCPDVCPLTLNILNQTVVELEKFNTHPRNIFISVDPKRDQPNKLKEYVEHFSNKMIGLTGDKMQIDTLTRSLGAIYAIANDSTDNYLVDHGAHVFVIAPDGKMVALFSTPHDAKVIADDFKIISTLYKKQTS